MNKKIILPKLSVIGIKKNSTTYFPYITAGIISVFVFFVFASIMHNDIMKTLPHSSYVTILMGIGLVLLGMILIPFLIYTNSFLIKRRKKELGLYSILGLEKKHIAIMMVCETTIIFCIVFSGGIIFGIVFSKLAFLLLLNLSGIPVDTTFSFNFKAFKGSFFYFLAAYGINLLINLFQVFRSNPNELMKGAKKGDKEPKYLWVTALFGILFLGVGYYVANTTKLDSMIFANSFLAIALVVVGTHNFFAAGIIALLKVMKRNKNFYYHKSNYVTISGMFYRMKKSASSLANICIFSTMTIITLLCTLSLWSGTDGILHYQYPYDIVLNFNEKSFDGHESLKEKLQEIARETNIYINDQITFTYQKLHVSKNGNSFVKQNDFSNIADNYAIKLISLQDYNQMEQKTELLEDNEIFIFTAGSDFGYESVILNEKEYRIKKELDEIVFSEKAVNNTFKQEFYLIIEDETLINQMAMEFESFKENDRIYTVRFQIEGSDENKKKFLNRIGDWCKIQKGFNSIENGIFGREEIVSMNGGLLFIGIFFGIIFSMCLVLIMYYKQITEGFEDREHFNIMQRVGMSDQEVKSTIKRQILFVFFFPLFMAVIHTIAGFGMTAKLLGTLFLFNTKQIAICGVIVAGFFACLYGFSYVMTSKIYYRIVK